MIMGYTCKCGETNQNKFYGRGRNQCQECCIIKASERHKRCRQIDINEKLDRGKCVACSLVVTPDTIHHFEWNHIEPSEKAYNISNIVTNTSRYSSEVKKCELVCLFCHANITKQQRIDGKIRRRPRLYGL